ncbi:MAG TPA: agmatinase [Chloroflexota bacterium]
MKLIAPTVPFLAATEGREAKAIIIGAPLDLTESFRAGTAAAPSRVRAVSDVLETYSPLAGRDLSDLPLADWGDLSLFGSMEASLAAIGEGVARARSVGLPLMIGGEHTATVGAVRALRLLYPELYVLQMDAHLDLRDDYDGVPLSHATVMRRIGDEVGLERIVQVGVRSGTREEFALARHCLASRSDLQLSKELRSVIGDHPVYLTIDIDVMDPSAAPGTGCPEPGGPAFAEVLAFVHSLRGMNVVAVDVVEVLPAADVNDITSIAAAKLVRDAALLFA